MKCPNCNTNLVYVSKYHCYKCPNDDCIGYAIAEEYAAHPKPEGGRAGITATEGDGE